MEAQAILEHEWPFLLSYLPSGLDLDASAFASGALRRKREVDSASSLLRLVLAYGLCDLSLRQTAAWAQAAQLAELSDVALLKRFKHAASWLGEILGAKLAERAAPTQALPRRFHLRVVDATSISRPGSAGTDWRVHLGYDLDTLTIDSVELTDAHGGESLLRFAAQPNEIIIGDRTYATRRGLCSIRQSQAHFIVRLGWRSIPLCASDGGSFALLSFLRGLPDGVAQTCDLYTAPDPPRQIPSISCRLVAVRKTEAAAEASRKDVLRDCSRKGRSVDPHTLEAAGYSVLLTSLDGGVASAEELLELYRFRWQIEIVFKRLKGLLALSKLPAKQPELARTFILAKLLAALLLDDFTERFLAFSPWGFRISQAPAVSMAHPKSSA